MTMNVRFHRSDRGAAAAGSFAYNPPPPPPHRNNALARIARRRKHPPELPGFPRTRGAAESRRLALARG